MVGVVQKLCSGDYNFLFFIDKDFIHFTGKGKKEKFVYIIYERTT
jgi:hypothetical protein